MYKVILAKLKNRQFAQITMDDYVDLTNTLIIDHYAHVNGGEEIPDDYFELRKWIYDRVEVDVLYKSTGYLNEHFCIGVIYGALCMFDNLNGYK